MKIPAVLPPQAAAAAARSAVNTQTLSGAPLLSCLTPQAGSLGTFSGKGLRVKDSVTSSVSSSANGSANGGCSSLGISNISGSFGTSVPDPGGMAAPCKDSESLSPSPSLEEVPPSPLMGAELQECQSLWVKIELSLLSRLPGSGDRSRGAITDRGGGLGGGGASEGRERVATQREREKEWQGGRERVKSAQGERSEVVEEGERAGEREERERTVALLGERERPAVRDKVLEEAGGPEQNQQRSNGKHRRGAAVSGGTPAERHVSKRKNKVENHRHHQHSAFHTRH